MQHGLFSRWSADPDDAPAQPPDLGEVRPVLDKLTEALLDELEATRELRADRDCEQTLRSALCHAEHGLDGLHREAMHRATRSICVTAVPVLVAGAVRLRPGTSR